MIGRAHQSAGPATRRAHPAPRRWASAGATVALLALAMVSTPIASHAAEGDISFSLSFESLVPGVPSTQMVELDIPRAGEIGSFSWVERTGILKTAHFALDVCATDGHCTPSNKDAEPVLVEAGKLPVRVTVVISEYGSGTAIGELTLASEGTAGLGERSDEPFSSQSGLASTGANLASAGLWATAALALGTVAWLWPRAILVAARRRRNAHEDDEVKP